VPDVVALKEEVHRADSRPRDEGATGVDDLCRRVVVEQGPSLAATIRAWEEGEDRSSDDGGGARTVRLGRRRGGSAAADWVGVRGRVWERFLARCEGEARGKRFFSLVRLDRLGGLRVGPGDVQSGGMRAGADALGSGRKAMELEGTNFFLHFILFRSRHIYVFLFLTLLK
jgi:hypothetical protein